MLKNETVRQLNNVCVCFQLSAFKFYPKPCAQDGGRKRKLFSCVSFLLRYIRSQLALDRVTKNVWKTFFSDAMDGRLYISSSAGRASMKMYVYREEIGIARQFFLLMFVLKNLFPKIGFFSPAYTYEYLLSTCRHLQKKELLSGCTASTNCNNVSSEGKKNRPYTETKRSLMK